ncbi:DUF4136 domain-containing protein [Antarcticibacterium flavum]|uniref:DUF4136 domain-containing protein n=1 Tax=Antarcticibacterium flavum TaxID=2058175 RepID=A0A5B7X842_9FLAO|nr:MULTISPECIES: DUF4136 domain-containing protein [Antarcticibacterium]MCM4159559.1 DUF4136 domain-containing protein [Antarcticibacterium sp. W02-3]QCY70811.1 DUF4136 domain-containing protein [Antarcticibacterium flavum]
MRFLKITIVVLLFAVTFVSCNSVRVASDYDQQVDFNQYQTYAFFKPGIDKAEISDLDKKRILRAIETEMAAKGFTKSEDPDMLVSIFTKTRENINVYNHHMMGWGGLGWGYGWGWNPWFWGPQTSVNTNSEGTLYIDFVDAERKELVWQGMGSAVLAKKVDRKQERINEIVKKMLETYPPGTRR